MRRSSAGLVALVLLAATAVACGDDGRGGSSNPQAALQVVATTTVVADFARVIGGDRVGVYGVLKPNVDAHDYEPSPADLNAMKRAKVIVTNGVGLEEWLEDTIDSSGTTATVVDASKGVTLREGGREHADGEHDPHIWHDPKNAKVMVADIATAFAAADPTGAAVYERNLAAYTAELDALDAELARTFGALANKKLVTNHDAFGYLVDAYGLEFVGSIIPSFDTSAELSAADLKKLVAAIRAEGVKAVFSESSLPAKTAKTIASEAGVQVVAGDGALYGDGLGPADSDGGTYLKMMRHNATTIAKNLA